MLSSAENRCVASEKEGCDIINTLLSDILPSLTVGKIKMATNPVNMGSVAVFYFVTICAIL